MAENSSPVDVTVVVEGTVSPPTPPTNVTATAVASTSRKSITEVGLSHFTPFILVTFIDGSSGPLATVQNDTFDKAMAVF